MKAMPWIRVNKPFVVRDGNIPRTVSTNMAWHGAKMAGSARTREITVNTNTDKTFPGERLSYTEDVE